jgi:hypothetical protein
MRSTSRLGLRSFVVALSLAASAGALPAVAYADGDGEESPDGARADKLFEEGRKLMSDGRYAEACPKFEESQKLRPGIGTLFNMADCHEKAGKLELAYDEFKEVVERTKAALQPDRQKVAEERLASLEARLSRLVISVPATRTRVTVSLDGTALPADHLNVPMVVTAGDHEIKASTDRDEGEPFETTVSLPGGGKTTTVAIPISPGAKMKRRTGMIVAGGVLMGVGVAAGVGTAYLATQTDSNPGPVIGLGVLSIASLAVGIPLFAVGMKKRPVVDRQSLLLPVSPVPQIGVGLGAATATWQF